MDPDRAAVPCDLELVYPGEERAFAGHHERGGKIVRAAAVSHLLRPGERPFDDTCALVPHREVVDHDSR